mgnify:FL=1
MTDTTTTTRKIVLNWGGLMYDEEVAQETGIPGLCWAIDPSDSVEYWEDGNRVGEPSMFRTMAAPCFTRLEHAVGYFLGHLPAEWRAAEIVLPDDVHTFNKKGDSA